MTFRQLELLSENKEYRDLVTNGICIGERSTDKAEVLLFQVKNNYVEVFFSQDNDSSIFYAYHFSDTDSLEPYLNQIDLSCIVSFS